MGTSSRFVGHLSLGTSVLCGQPAALCSKAAGRPGTKGQQSGQAGQLTFCTVPPRYGYAVVISGCYSSRPCVIFALWAVLAKLRSVLGKNAAKPSGQPECGRPGRWRRQCQSSRICSATYVAAQNPHCQPQTAPVCVPHQRRSEVPQFEGQCLFAKTVISRITVSTALTPLGPSGPGRGGRLPTVRASLFRCSREPVVSLPRRSRACRPHTQDRLRGHAPLRSAPYGTARLLAATRTTLAQRPGG